MKALNQSLHLRYHVILDFGFAGQAEAATVVDGIVFRKLEESPMPQYSITVLIDFAVLFYLFYAQLA